MYTDLGEWRTEMKKNRCQFTVLMLSTILIIGSFSGPVFGSQTSTGNQDSTVVEALEMPDDIDKTEESEVEKENSDQSSEIESKEETEESTENAAQETEETYEELQRVDDSGETFDQSAQDEVVSSEEIGNHSADTYNASMGDSEATTEDRLEESVNEEGSTEKETVITVPAEQESISTTDNMDSVQVEESGVIDSGSCGENATWTLTGTEDKLTLSILGNGEMKNYDLNDNRPPWFIYSDNIEQIEIENGITSIGDSSFYNCSSAETISIPDSVTKFGEYAFVQCSRLSSITIPDGITVLKEAVFSGCSNLKSITIPDSVTTIEAGAFSSCTSLISMEIPNSVTKFTGGGQFEQCTSLETLILPNTIDYIGEQFCCRCESLKRIEIPEGVKEIDARAFYDCIALEEIIIPDSVELIEGGAFYYS